MEVCKLCNKEYKNMGSHLRKAHDMSTEDYTLMYSDDTELTDELSGVVETDLVVTEEERKDRIMDTKVPISEEMTVGALLIQKELTLQDLISIIKQFKSGTPSLAHVEKQNAERGLAGAKKLLDDPTPSTGNLHVAEALCTKFGFEVTHITQNPKTWHLVKPSR